MEIGSAGAGTLTQSAPSQAQVNPPENVVSQRATLSSPEVQERPQVSPPANQRVGSIIDIRV
ncbi:hypothetical protein [Paraglaciecola aestuariivivens]